MKRFAIRFAVISLALLFSFSIPAKADDLERSLGEISVQQGGRTKPLSSFAREAVLYITGRTRYEGMDATIVIWKWIGNPAEWSTKSFIPVKHPELREYFSADLEKGRISPSLVTSDLAFSADIRTLRMRQKTEEPLTEVEKKKLAVWDKARFFEEIASGRTPGVIPHPTSPAVSWLPLEAILVPEGIEILKNIYPAPAADNVSTTIQHLRDRLSGGNIKEALTAAEHFNKALTNMFETRDVYLSTPEIKREIWYFKLRPFYLAWVLYLVSALLWLVPRKRTDKKVARAGFAFFLAGFGFHTYGFILRVLISGRAPVTNMYETVVWVPWAVVLFSIGFWFFYRSHLLSTIAAIVATMGLILAESFPMFLDPSMSPLVPVLRSNFWLTIHVLTITLGYGAFALNWGVAHALLFNLAVNPSKKKRIENLTEFLYRTLQVGVILLGVGIVLGGVWANYSWGRFWGWDPKETWALIALMAYIAVFHGRTAGWIDQFGVAFWSAISFLSVIMAWYGVNFVLGVGLHSYGFGGGGLQYVGAVVAADVILLLFFKRRYKMANQHG